MIIAVIILVGVLGVVGGVFLQSNLSNNKNPVVVNQTNASVNQTNNVTSAQTTKQNTSSQDNNKPKITASQAEQIATNNVKGYAIYGASAVLSESNGHPIWIVNLEGDSSGSNGPPGYNAGQCKVDAITGKFLG